MPTILIKLGWRFYFFVNEGSEPIHIHCKHAEKQCKFWLYPEEVEIELVYHYHMNNKDLKQVKKIIYENLDYFEIEWRKYHD
jgi:hypothetical protein